MVRFGSLTFRPTAYWKEVPIQKESYIFVKKINLKHFFKMKKLYNSKVEFINTHTEIKHKLVRNMVKTCIQNKYYDMEI